MKRKIIILATFIVVIVVITVIIKETVTQKEVLDENGYYTETTTINQKKPTYKNPIIPQGFRTIDTETSSWKLENNRINIQDVNNGLVIEDKEGNQFVWIPVDKKTVTLSRKVFWNNEIKSVDADEDIDRIYYSEENIYSCLYKEQGGVYSIEYFKKSVEKYGGFYIARYETGKNKDSEEKIVVKSGYYPYTEITRDEALEKSKEVYSSNADIVSSLINSYAWDTTLEFINGTNPNYYNNSDKTNTGGIKKTGENNDIACNINDLAGNIREWSTEYSSNGYYSYLSSCVMRGGYYNNSRHTASSRFYNGEDVKNQYIGFRVILYIK